MDTRMMGFALGLLVLLAFAGGGPVRAQEGELKVGGSTTVYSINEQIAYNLMGMYPLQITVEGTGSSAGIRGAGDGTYDIGAASRDPKAEELAQYPYLQFHLIGKDSVAVVVNPSNPVSDLTDEQISMIFAGEITEWSEVGGGSAPITVYTTPGGSSLSPLSLRSWRRQGTKDTLKPNLA